VLAWQASMTVTGDHRQWWREPLLHFLVLGALVFVGHRAFVAPPASDRIAHEDVPIEQIREDWSQAKGGPPSAEQEAALVGEWIDEEVLYRRAIELGLDQNDTIVRRRLIQRMRFLLEDTSGIEPPSEAELEAWFDQHPDEFALPQTTSFEHVFFSRGKRGATLPIAAETALRDLRARSDVHVVADPFFRGSEFDDVTSSQIQRAFGKEFAEALDQVPLDSWSGPLKSSYGLHLVLVSERTPGRTPPFENVAEQVERNWLEEERSRRNRQALERLRALYTHEEER